MKIPCCQEPTGDNIRQALSRIRDHYRKTGQQYVLIENTGKKLEVVPKKSLSFLKLTIPDLKIYTEDDIH